MAHAKIAILLLSISTFLCLTLAFRSSSSLKPKGRMDREGPLLRKIQMNQGQEDQDPVEKLFSFFFGQKEEEPLGLKRFNKETFPDQFPATKTEFADPVPGDSKDMAVFRPLLKQTELESRKLKLVYDANKNGWNPTAFHKGVDKLGPGVIVAKTKGGAVIGGYNPKGWVGYGEYRPGLSAFLFTWPDGNTVDYTKALKLRKIGGAGLAVIDKPEEGPVFGADGLCIRMAPKKQRIAQCSLGSYYERMPGGKKSLFAQGESLANTELVDLKAYVGIYAKGEEIPFNDAIPFSLT